MVFVRPDIGYRMVNPLWLAGVTLALLILSSFASEESRPDDLLVFAVLVLTLGLRQRYLRWHEIRRGVRQHSFYLGTSAFAALKLPAILRSDRRIERIVEPIVCALVGVLLLSCSKALATWMLLAALCLRAFEEVIYHREFQRKLDMVDGMVASEVQTETVERFSPPPDQTLHHMESVPGIPTGIGGDISERIQKRKSNA